MFSQWLAGLFHDGYTSSGDHRKHGMSVSDEHSHAEQDETDRQHAAGNMAYGMPHAISADKIVIDASSAIETGSITTNRLGMFKTKEEEVYIEKMTNLLQELNERLAECPAGVTVSLELVNASPFNLTVSRPVYRLEGTVGKTL